mmetsp:Transcript_37384/g.45081  ORF Transcript_37384/g.45081 Transcript_37384/m.45081 type:complete len:259 (-) Transcript_37384:286-1062(-)
MWLSSTRSSNCGIFPSKPACALFISFSVSALIIESPKNMALATRNFSFWLSTPSEIVLFLSSGDAIESRTICNVYSFSISTLTIIEGAMFVSFLLLSIGFFPPPLLCSIVKIFMPPSSSIAARTPSYQSLIFFSSFTFCFDTSVSDRVCMASALSSAKVLPSSSWMSKLRSFALRSSFKHAFRFILGSLMNRWHSSFICSDSDCARRGLSSISKRVSVRDFSVSSSSAILLSSVTLSMIEHFSSSKMYQEIQNMYHQK